ncbi:MAG: tetratricopeptide repeat protein [Crocinitomicaceae bacterium]
MIKHKLLLCVGLGLFSTYSHAQIEELTPAEKKYRDSITALNMQNATIANSQNAYNDGIKFFSEGKYQQARDRFKQSLSFDPNFTAASYNLGVTENELGSYADASKTLSQLIEKDPSYSKAYFQRGRAYQGLNEYLKAENDYDKSIALDPSNPRAYYNYGTLRFLQQDYKTAITYFTKAIELIKTLHLHITTVVTACWEITQKHWPIIKKLNEKPKSCLLWLEQHWHNNQ